MSPLKARPASSKDANAKRSSSPKKKVMKDNFVENLKKMLEDDLAKPETKSKPKEKPKPKPPKPAEKPQ